MVRLSSRHNEVESEDDSCTPRCFGSTTHELPDVADKSPGAGAQRSSITSSIHAKKKQLDGIWTVHAFVAGVTGTAALVCPQAFEFFMNFDEDQPKCRHMAEQANTIIRLYGALILSQSWLVWKTREVGDPFVRKIFVQGYFLCFSVSTLILAYTQMFTSDWKRINWVFTGLFGSLTAVYGWFLSTKKLPEFEHGSAGAV